MEREGTADHQDHETQGGWVNGWLKAIRNRLFATKAAVFNALDGVPIHRFTDYESYLKAGSSKLWATWKATDITANVVMDTPYRLLDRRGEPLERPPAPLQRLLTFPNQHETFSEVLYKSVFHLKWVGNCFWLKSETTMDGERPREMFMLNPSRIKIIPDRELGVSGYIYQVKGEQIPLDIEDVIHFRRPHPNNEFFGLGEMEAGEKSLSSQINRDTYEEKFWQNGGVPSGIMKAKFQADQQDLELAQKRFQEKYGGVSNSAKVAFITGDYEFQQLGLSSQQMQFLEQRKSNVEEIFLLHGVPLSVAGIRDAANFACLPGEQHVYTPKGPVPIKDLNQGDPIHQWTEEGFVENSVKKIIPQGEADVYEIKTRTRTLKASCNHPFLVVRRKDGTHLGPYRSEKPQYKYEWIRADQIRESDVIVTMEAAPKFNGKEEWRGIPLTEEFMEIAGLFTGDGDWQDRTLRFAIHEDDRGAQAIYAEKAERVFNKMREGHYLTRFGSVKAKPNKTHFAIHSAIGCRIFMDMGLTGNSISKTVPDWVFGLSEPLKLAYLRGVLDSDGTVDSARGQICFAFGNRELCKRIRALCIECGIPVSNVKTNTLRTNFGVYEATRFTCGYAHHNQRIGSNHPLKSERLNRPKQVRKNGLRRAPYVNWREFTDKLPDGVGVDKVISAKYVGQETVYDLAATGSHTFVAEGIVVHNTAEIDDNRFRRYTIKPLIKTFRDTINTDLIAGFGDMFLEWEVSGLHPIGKIIQDYVPLFDRGGMTINELRAKAGLPTDPDNPLWENQTFINAGMLPLDLAGLTDMGRTDQAARSIVDDFTRRALTPGQANRNGRNHELEGRA